MARIKVISECPFYDGMSVTFKAPCDCTAASGLKVYYEETSQTFDFADAHGNNLAGLGNLFAKDAYVKVILNTGESKAFIQNADTNAYLERRLASAGTGGGGASNVAYDATPLVTAEATDPDGNTYTGATEYETTIPDADEPFVGMQIVVVPTMVSATMQPFITVNGVRSRIYTNAATTGAYFNGTRVDFIGANKPLALMYMGIVDESTGMGGWKCLNSVRVNVEALMSNGDAGVNKIPMSNGAGEKLVWRTHKEASLVGDATYKSSANRYDVTLPGIGNAETGGNGVYKGLEVTIIPDVTNKAKAKLAVNNYDGTASGSQIYLSTGEGTEGYVSVPAGFLKAGMPVKMKYTGAGWRITDTPYSVFGKSGGTMSDEEGISETTLSPYGVEIEDIDLRSQAKFDISGVHFTVSTDEGKVAGGGRISGLMDAMLDHEAVPYGQFKAELDVVKTSVSEGKALIASAVTDKGVTTADDATFAQIAENIALIQGGELAGDEEGEEVYVTPSKSVQEVTPSEGCVLSKVTVEPIPDEYIQPSGTLDITENGEHDVTEYAAVSVNVASGGGDDEYKETLIGVLDRTATNPVLPDGLTSIGSWAFQGCTNLALTSLPSSITSISTYAFQGCAKLALTSLPSGITSIGTYAFANCTNLALTSLPSSITSISNSAFSKCTNLALTSLPSGITSIGTYAFANCTNLALTSLPSSITSINGYAFDGCTNLALTSLPSSITSIGPYAFKSCTRLENITFEGKPTTIKNTAFKNCTNLTAINVPWAEGEVADAPWGATNATINYNYTGG